MCRLDARQQWIQFAAMVWLVYGTGFGLGVALQAPCVRVVKAEALCWQVCRHRLRSSLDVLGDGS